MAEKTSVKQGKVQRLVGGEIIPDQESCQPTPTVSVLYCDNLGCAANEEERCMSTVGECYGYMKPNVTGDLPGR